MNRQKKSLLALFILLLLAIGYSYWMMPEQQRVAKHVVKSRSDSAVNLREGYEPVRKNRVRIDLLEKEPTQYKGYKRDIFNYAVVKPKPAPKPKPKPPTVVKPPPPPRPASGVNQVVRQQLARFTFLGFLIKDELHTVFLSRGEDLFLVQENDRFGDNEQFTAISISPEVMSIRQVGDSRTIDIQLVEKEPLVPTMRQSDESTPMRSPQPPPAQNKWPRSKTPAVKR